MGLLLGWVVVVGVLVGLLVVGWWLVGGVGGVGVVTSVGSFFGCEGLRSVVRWEVVVEVILVSSLSALCHPLFVVCPVASQSSPSISFRGPPGP